jgi:hypothetical protein
MLVFEGIFLNTAILASQIALIEEATKSTLPTWLRNACLNSTFGEFTMDTLLEMILHRSELRLELLDAFLMLSCRELSAADGQKDAPEVFDVQGKVSLKSLYFLQKLFSSFQLPRSCTLFRKFATISAIQWLR